MRRLAVALTLAVVFAVKLYYRHATAADLEWILRPTVGLVELATRISFVKETGIGYFNREVGFAVIPACAGVNFLVAAFATLMLTQLHRRLWLLFPLAAAGAFLATLVANAARLAVAVELHRRHVSWLCFTPPRLHQLEGVVIYVTALFLLALAARREPCAA